MKLGISVTCRQAAEGVLRACLVLCGSAALAIIPSGAHAHTDLATALPAAETTVRKAPNVVRLVFSEPVTTDLAVVLVRNAAGDNLAIGPVREAPPGLAQPIAKLTVPGRYTVLYRVVSVDGHPVTGSYPFRFAPPEREVPPAEASPAGAPTGAPTGPVTGPASADAPSSEVDSGSSVMGPVLGGASVALAIALGGLLSMRRRRTSGPSSS